MNALTKKPALVKVAAAFALGGGLGIPCLFLALGALLQQPSLGDKETMFHLFGWVDAFRIMFWPSWLLSLAPPGDGTFWIHLAIGIVLNVGLYGAIGLFAALSLTNQVAQIVLMIAFVSGLYGLNAFWSGHLESFFVATVLLVLLFVGFFYKFGVTPAREAGAEPRPDHE